MVYNFILTVKLLCGITFSRISLASGMEEIIAVKSTVKS